MTSRVDGGTLHALEAHLDFHLNAGVDVVLLEGNVGTLGYGDRVLPAGTKVDADWSIDANCDEFWWPRGGGSLREILEHAPGRYGAVQAVVRTFVPVAGDEEFAERMTYRLRGRPGLRHATRTGADSALPVLRGWYPLEVLRFPLQAAASEAITREDLGRAVSDGAVCVDTRLRDALRLLAEGRSPEFDPPGVVDDADLALDLAALGDRDVVDAHTHLDELEARLVVVESTVAQILKRRLRRLLRRSERS